MIAVMAIAATMTIPLPQPERFSSGSGSFCRTLRSFGILLPLSQPGTDGAGMVGVTIGGGVLFRRLMSCLIVLTLLQMMNRAVKMLSKSPTIIHLKTKLLSSTVCLLVCARTKSAKSGT